MTDGRTRTLLDVTCAIWKYRALLREHEELVDVTIETQHCHDHESVDA